VRPEHPAAPDRALYPRNRKHHVPHTSPRSAASQRIFPLRTFPLRFLSLAALTALTLGGCASAAPAADQSSATSTPHGFVEGAAEAAEPQLHLATVSGTGDITLLDLLDESRDTLGTVDAASAVSTDGRYLFVSSETTGELTVIDTGVWTIDHEDHFHYYRADARVVGMVSGRGEAVVASGPTVTGVWFAESGEGVLLDSAALGIGEITEVARIDGEPHSGMLVPFGDAVLATAANTDGIASRVEVLGIDGTPSASAGAECAALSGSITTRVGVVFGCADGALLATPTDTGITFESIPYPADALGNSAGVTGSDRALEFRNRDGRPSVAAVAGTRGAWILDTRERSWTLLPTDVPLLQVSAADDTGDHVVALAADGRVLVMDAASGTILSSTEPIFAASLADPAPLAGVELTVDTTRAYINSPADNLLYEIDYADGARIARTFDVESPAFLAETGR
jgi:hypothetical protein